MLFLSALELKSQENIKDNGNFTGKNILQISSLQITYLQQSIPFAADVLIFISESACPPTVLTFWSQSGLSRYCSSCPYPLFLGTQVLIFPSGGPNPRLDNWPGGLVFLGVGSCLDFMAPAWKLPSPRYGLGPFHCCTPQTQTPWWPGWDLSLDTILFCWSVPPAGLESFPSPMAIFAHSPLWPIQRCVQSSDPDPSLRIPAESWFIKVLPWLWDSLAECGLTQPFTSWGSVSPSMKRVGCAEWGKVSIKGDTHACTFYQNPWPGTKARSLQTEELFIFMVWSLNGRKILPSISHSPKTPSIKHFGGNAEVPKH